MLDFAAIVNWCETTTLKMNIFCTVCPFYRLTEAVAQLRLKLFGALQISHVILGRMCAGTF